MLEVVYISADHLWPDEAAGVTDVACTVKPIFFGGKPGEENSYSFKWNTATDGDILYAIEPYETTIGILSWRWSWVALAPIKIKPLVK